MPFTPIHSVLGGLCIGLSTYHNGRIYQRVTGISGFLFRAPSSSQSALFVSGLMLSGVLLRPVFPILQVARLAPIDLAKLLTAGALVGIGTRLANGCTSGHGISGVCRLSIRSITATMLFMITGVMTATLTRLTDIYNLPPETMKVVLPTRTELSMLLGLVVASGIVPPLLVKISERAGKARVLLSRLVHVSLGAVFGVGLIISGMASPAKTAAFLTIGPAWEPSLPFVFVGALPVAAAGLRQIAPVSSGITRRLTVGAVLFGVGWGLLGLCPGPGLVYAGAWPGWQIASFGAAVLSGGTLVGRLADKIGF